MGEILVKLGPPLTGLAVFLVAVDAASALLVALGGLPLLLVAIAALIMFAWVTMRAIC